MANVRLTTTAKWDLAEIDAYGALTFGVEVAGDYARGFREVFDLLRRHPLAGAARSELGKGVRSILHRRHRIFYIVTGDQVQILRVFHYSRDVQSSYLQ